MSETVKERLSEYLQSIGVNKSEFGRRIGVSSAFVTSMRKSIQPDKIKAIQSEFPTLNIKWLMTGEGEMLQSESSGIDDESPVINYKYGVPYYDESFELGFNELVAPSSESPEFLIHMPKYAKATMWCNVTGESMRPEICSGDVVALQLVEDPSFLIMGDVYAIITNNDLRTIKRLRKGHTQDSYTMVPSNPDYEEQQLPISHIRRIFRVLGSLHSF